MSAGSSSSSLLETARETTEKIAEGQVDSTDTSVRYLGLLGRARAVLIPATRYLAYTSDVGALEPALSLSVLTVQFGLKDWRGVSTYNKPKGSHHSVRNLYILRVG